MLCSDFGAQEKKICHCFHFFPIYLPWSEGTGCHDLFFECWVLSQVFISSLTLSRGSLVPLHFLQLGWYHLHVWGCWYFPGNLDSSLCPTFRMIYSAFKLNKQGDNIQPCHTPFPILNQSVVPCLVLIFASSPTYRFFRRQVKWSGTPISFEIF